MNLKKIATVKNGYTAADDIPKQGYLGDRLMEIVIEPAYYPAMTDIKAGDSLQVVYFGNRARRNLLRVTPPHGDEELGVFSTRAPHRPNPTAICIVKVIRVADHVLFVKGLDAMDESPVVDIKAYSQSYHDKLLKFD